ncbi:MAG: cupin domain-containing protein [Candidatus Limnocylindrales bacterium]
MPATRTSIESSRKVPMSKDRGVNHVLVDGDGLNNVSIQVQEFKVGAAFGTYHYHESSDNIYVVLNGTIQAVVDGETHVLSEGELLFIPAGSPHMTTNGGDIVARALEIYAPPAGADSHAMPDPRTSGS